MSSPVALHHGSPKFNLFEKNMKRVQTQVKPNGMNTDLTSFSPFNHRLDPFELKSETENGNSMQVVPTNPQ